MDCNLLKERDVVIDIESCVDTVKEIASPSVSDTRNGQVDTRNGQVLIKVCDLPMSVDDSVKCGNSAIIKTIGEVTSPDSAKNVKKNKHNTSGKRPCKPPRPPRGFSLDAADQKLIKEITELAMIKRARIERMKALKKMRAAKASSTPASSSGNLISMLFTLLFCAVIIFQGCHSSGISTRNSSKIGGSVPMELSPNTAPLTGPGSPILLESISNSDVKYQGRKAIS